MLPLFLLCYSLMAMEEWNPRAWKSIKEHTPESRQNTLQKIVAELSWVQKEVEHHYNGPRRAEIDPLLNQWHTDASMFLTAPNYQYHEDGINKSIDTFLNKYCTKEQIIKRAIEEIRQEVSQEQELLNQFNDLSVTSQDQAVDDLINALSEVNI